MGDGMRGYEVRFIDERGNVVEVMEMFASDDNSALQKAAALSRLKEACFFIRYLPKSIPQPASHDVEASSA
jgi:hypothetical protein